MLPNNYMAAITEPKKNIVIRKHSPNSCWTIHGETTQPHNFLLRSAPPQAWKMLLESMAHGSLNFRRKKILTKESTRSCSPVHSPDANHGAGRFTYITGPLNWGFYVGKYSSTMVRIWVHGVFSDDFSGYSKLWFGDSVIRWHRQNSSIEVSPIPKSRWSEKKKKNHQQLPIPWRIHVCMYVCHIFMVCRFYHQQKPPLC